MARVVTLAELPLESTAPGVARGSITAGQTSWMDAEIVRLKPGAKIEGTVPAGSDLYLFVTRGAAALSAGGQAHAMPLQASAVVQEKTAFTLANPSEDDSFVLRVVAPPEGAANGLSGFTGGVAVRTRDELPMVLVPEQKKKRFYIVSKETARSDRGHAMIVGYEKDTVTALHHHPDAESMFILLEGSIRFVIDGKETVVGPGEATVFRAGDRHSLRCAEGVTQAAFLEFHIPAAFSTVKE